MMKTKAKTMAALLALVLSFTCTQARAQYAVTLQGCSEICPAFPGGDGGAELLLGRELPYGIVQVGFAALFPGKADTAGQEEERQSSGALMKATMDASYMLRLYGNRTHSVNLYLGGGAFGGYAMTDADGGQDARRGYLLAGVFPQAELELFPLDRAALVLGARAPYALYGEKGMAWQATAGLRILIGKGRAAR